MKQKQHKLVAAAEPVPGSENHLVGRRFIRLLEDHLDHLHRRRAHRNRRVSLDHLVMAHLLAFFNPNVRGLRSIEDIFEHPRLRKLYQTPRLPKSTVSDAQRLFDPELLVPLMEALRQQAGAACHDHRLDSVSRQVLAVDGSFFTVAPRIAWALYNNSGKGNVRLHVQFNVRDGLPDHVGLTDGQTREDHYLRQHLQKDRFYVMDRGFQDYDLLQDILDAKSDFLVRLRQTSRQDTLEERPLTAADQTAGVRCDRVVRLGWRADHGPDLGPLRWVEVAFINRHGEEDTMILLTNRLDLPAWLIALLYQYRWQVELFFRWLKCMAHFEHFFSESLSGMTLQVYVTMIGLLLIALETASRPSKYDYALVSAAVSGLMPLDDALEIAARRRAERKRAAEWQKAYNARKKIKG